MTSRNCWALGLVLLLVLVWANGARAEALEEGVALESHGVTLALGESTALGLTENASTGYHWELVGSPDQAVANLGRTGLFSGCPDDMVGCPGTAIWTIKALGRGVTQASLAYMPPGKGGAPAKRVYVTITVP